jgi:hypothetical protein
MAPPIYTPTGSLIQQSAKLFLGATDFLASGTATFTREAKGKYYWAVGASQTVQLAADLTTILRNFRPANINYQYKGVESGPLTLTSVTAEYLVSVANLTSATISVSKTTYPADNTATTASTVDLLAPANLSVGFRANLYQTVLTPTNQAILPASTDQLTAELIVVTPVSSTFRFYGILLDLNYNV